MARLGLRMETNHVKDVSPCTTKAIAPCKQTPRLGTPFVHPSGAPSVPLCFTWLTRMCSLNISEMPHKTRHNIQECDFEGRPFRSSSLDHDECYLVFTGLERTGHDLGTLNVTALFGINGTQQTAKATSPLQARVFSSPCGLCAYFGTTAASCFR